MIKSNGDSKKSDTEHDKKKKNIREIYLQALNNSRDFKNIGQNKRKGFTNLSNEDNKNISFNGSSYLEKEYNLVQRIISDTKELKSIKAKNNEGLTKTDQLTQTARRLQQQQQIVHNYKTQEEYYQEILELKKTLKIYENNEVINKAKFEYYENEMNKKEQEILDLLDIKKNEELRLTTDSKNDLTAMFYGLKQKAYKLEFNLKRKDNELNKLKTDIKTTNMKELKMQNERLRFELSKALMNDTKIIEAFEKEGIIDKNGGSFYESQKYQNISVILKETSLDKRLAIKENVAKQLRGELLEDGSEFTSKFKNAKGKLVLKGTLLEKLHQLDQRETDLLEEIDHLKEEIEDLKDKAESNNSKKGKKSPRNESDETDKENDDLKKISTQKVNSIKKLQSIFRGHLIRSDIYRLNEELLQKEIEDRKAFEREREREERERLRYEQERERRRIEKNRDDRNNRRDRRRRESPHGERPHRKDTSSEANSENDDKKNEKKELIPDYKDVKKVDTSCCGCKK